VRDFAPYIAKIKASGADTVITGNWGSDLSLLVKAANEGGYNGKFFTYYAGVTGTPTALGTNGAGRVYQMAYNHYNMGGQMDKWMNEFKKKYNDDFYTGSTIRIFETLGAAMAKAKSTDPVKVAAALEGIRVKSFNGEVEMRKTDHQLQQPLYMTVWQRPTRSTPTAPRTPA
jgi:branched-chain amino acid transport system substrate-binding protein